MKWRNHIFYFLLILIAVAVFFGFKNAIVGGGMDKDGKFIWWLIYDKSLRTPLFTAFLTLGSFLLALKTNIVQRLQAAYESAEHENNYMLLRETNRNALYYGGLSRLAQALALNVASAIVASISQMAFGFVGTPWATSLCFTTAAVTLGLSLYLWLQIVMAHRDWFDSIEKKKRAEIDAKESKGAKKTE